MSADFIDSNIFIYLFDETSPKKRAVAENIIYKAIEKKESIISFQVVQETLNVLTTKIEKPLSAEDTKQFYEKVLLPLWKINPNPMLYSRALDIGLRFHYGFYDSLILSASIEAGCSRLLTEDLQDGQEVDSVRIHNPF